MKVFLLRHGQTNYNELGLCNADPNVDVHLSNMGVLQAKKLGEELKDVNIEHIYVSELKRTRQTADYINKFHNAPISIDSRLNDNKTGFEGKSVNEYYDVLENAPDKWSAKFNDGESLLDAKDKAQSFLDYLGTQNHNSVVVVTSMSIVQAMYGIHNGLSNDQAWEFQVDKGSCIELDLK